MVETRLRWFGNVERRPVDYVVRRLDKTRSIQITKCRGRPIKTIRETIKKDIEITEVD